MGRKRIMVAGCIIEDLIYGRLRTAKSDAPKGLEIISILDEMKPSSFERTGNIEIYVEHPDFGEIGRHEDAPELKVTFTNEMDLDTQELVKALRRIPDLQDEQSQITLNIVCEKLLTWDTKYYQLFEERNELRRENTYMRSVIESIQNIVKEH